MKLPLQHEVWNCPLTLRITTSSAGYQVSWLVITPPKTSANLEGTLAGAVPVPGYLLSIRKARSEVSLVNNVLGGADLTFCFIRPRQNNPMLLTALELRHRYICTQVPPAALASSSTSCQHHHVLFQPRVIRCSSHPLLGGGCRRTITQSIDAALSSYSSSYQDPHVLFPTSSHPLLAGRCRRTTRQSIDAAYHGRHTFDQQAAAAPPQGTSTAPVYREQLTYGAVGCFPSCA